MKLFKNRLFLAVICIIIATISIFAGIKLTEKQNETITVVKVQTNIQKGEVIKKDMITTTTIGAHNISDDYIKNAEEVIGKYALADLYPNDFIQKIKISEKLPSAGEKLLKLDGSRVAISVSLKDFARGLSDKIVSGDIVSCIVTKETGTEIPTELTYLEVITTTMPNGIDKEHSSDKEKENLATATLLATPEQAKLLAEYDKNAEIHLALVYRGDEITSQEFLNKQADVLQKPNVTEEN